MLMKYIVFISAAVFIIDLMDTTNTLFAVLSFNPSQILTGQVWRLVTWLFLPLNNNLLFTAIMLYFYYFIGTTLEREWGTPKFTLFYLLGVLLNIIYGFVIWIVLGSPNLASASLLAPNFLNLSMFFAFAALFPDHRVMLLFIIPIKIKWLAIINAFFFAYSIIVNLLAGDFIDAFLPLVAIFNFILFCGGDVLAYIRPHKSRFSGNTINFKKAAKKARRDKESQPYRHKCAVCGKTDTEYPNMEFRYCSRCDGYHCFCQDHINNHIHF
jgi:membrane associated rhomboid family serine protease